MSRSIAGLVFILGMLSGCASPPPTQVVLRTAPDIVAGSSVEEIFVLQEKVQSMTAEQVVTELATMSKPDTAHRLFYFGLLNQQSESHDNWIIARDVFRQLRASDTVAPEQQQLAAILEKYNQSRINWYQRYSLLQQELLDTQQQKLLLEQKIQAITDLESTISTRKEQ
jgi:hypothetical protein